MTSILISGGIVITMDPNRRVIPHGAVLVDGGRIAHVGRLDELRDRDAELEIDAEGDIILPGLVDTHVHLAQALIRGCADDVSLIEWLRDFVWPLQGNFEHEDGRTSAELCMLEMIKSGTTTFLESLLHSRYGFDDIAESLRKSGMRGILSKTVMSLPSYGAEQNIMHPGMIEDPEECLRDVEAHFRRWNGSAMGRIRVWYGARSLGGCSPELYNRIAEGARRLGTGITMHVSEVREDVSYSLNHFGKMPIQFLKETGIVGPNFLLAHGVWLEEPELRILAENHTSIAHCPSSNMKLASGIAPVSEMIRAGVNVGLGCDGGPSNNCYDMFREMKTAALLQKVRLSDPKVLPAEAVLEMATINGAKALGLEHEIGSIEVGKKADLILVSLKKPHLTPSLDPLSTLVYSAQGEDVQTVIIDGVLVMENRHVKTLDEAAILENANRRAERLLEKTGIKISRRVPA